MHNLREKSRWREQLAFEYKACLQKRRRVYLTLLLLPGVCKSHQSSAPARRRPPNCDPRLATAKWWPNSLPPAAHSSFCLIHVPLITIIIHNHGRTLSIAYLQHVLTCNTLHKLIKIFSRASFTARGGPATRVPRPRSSRATACVFRQKYLRGAKIFRIKLLFLQANPIVVLNALGYIGFKVVSTCGDTEVRK